MPFPLVTLALLASVLQASDDSTSQIRGRVSSAFNGKPIAGVTISDPRVKRSVVTDSTGMFWLDGLPAGPCVIRVSYDGRERDDESPFVLKKNSTQHIVILLEPDAEDLSPLIAEPRQAAVWRDLGGFFARRDLYTGFARFFTREDIERIKPKRISSLLTLEGIATRCGQWCVPTRLNRGVLCAVPISVDGMPFEEVDYDKITIAEVAGVEVYRGVPPTGLSVPLPGPPGPSLWVGGGAGGGLPPAIGSCGLVLIWTR
jgi:hypothetical protein